MNWITSLTTGLAALSLCAGAVAQDAPPRVKPDWATMELSAKATGAGIDLTLVGAYQPGLVAVFFGPENKQHVNLPGGSVLEVIPLGVLTWGKSEEAVWSASVSYEMRFIAGLTFRLQAFSLGSPEDEPPILRASRSILVKVPQTNADAER